MRHSRIFALCTAGVFVLSACGDTASEAEIVDRNFQGVNAIDGTGLNDVMLTVADPNEAVDYFRRALKDAPDNIEHRRGLAKSLIRAKRVPEGVAAWSNVVDHDEAGNEDRVAFADALIRSGEWDRAEETLDAIPPTHETFERYKLEAMVADVGEDWKRADSFYEVALGLTTQPAGILNNWGYSKLTRGEYSAAERLFTDAIRQDTSLFTAKNNLMLARAARGEYSIPVIPMSQIERAQLLHTLALAAIKKGDVETGKALLRDALETHPQHFEAAATSLDALEGTN
ncbi:Flp pilus assembly protein TadD, contains TPR repeats [Roseivivax lentus]|uniref:Flp pilus assembly protein TadD, contains TPR repeats n=1 Tax=Roseivivax lentus TaxID=633194 RepID=A0A1N7KY07_9RHOB|nr:tetratricopeptide repeat protein [Roseivivax lentus]SIS66310.1 Flp pilus assembly protein TadD, contains TPR repeats [Roseivivax lentus]